MIQETELIRKQRLLNDLAKFITTSGKVRVKLTERPITPCCDVSTGLIKLSNAESYNDNKAILLHESGHFIFTRAIKRFPRGVDDHDLFKNIINILEDIRTEFLISQIIPEAKKLLIDLEIGITKRNLSGDDLSETIRAVEHSFFIHLKSQEPHLKGMINFNINSDVKERVLKAYDYYKKNKNALINGTFTTAVKQATDIYFIMKEDKDEGDDGQDGQDGQDEDGQKVNPNPNPTEPNEDGEQHGSDNGQNESDGQDEDGSDGQDGQDEDGQKGNPKPETYEEREAREQKEYEDEQKEYARQQKERDLIDNINNEKGDTTQEDFKDEKNLKEKEFIRHDGQRIRGRDVEASDVIYNAVDMERLKRACKVEVIDFQEGE